MEGQRMQMPEVDNVGRTPVILRLWTGKKSTGVYAILIYFIPGKKGVCNGKNGSGGLFSLRFRENGSIALRL